MRGIILKHAMKQFGLKDGFSFWFRWSFRDPIEIFIWLNITHKPYCLYSGWYCKKENCPHKHLLTKKEISEEWEKHRKEADIVIYGSNGKCAYCNEEIATETIDDPNWDTLKRWKVCKTCKDVLDLQHDLHFHSVIGDSEKCQEINDELSDISKKTGKTIFNCSFTKKDDGGYSIESVTFDGKQNAH